MKTSLLHKEKLIVAGPCSAESEEQVLATARQLKEAGKTDIFRAGIWKPRTNPGGYEGAGIKGLAWLSKAKQETQLPIATEVATSKHVEDTLHYDVDVLWIGARTTVNPFSVQNIADALKGTQATVLIKNPVNPDLKLWIGAIERLQKAGIENIGLIHRGFSSFGEKQYRNSPIWQIPIEMKRLFPELPMICDPSHIGGNTESLFDISQKSLNLDYQGLMIETHENPNVAWTDKQQQITPLELSKLLEKLIWKKTSTDVSGYIAQLENLREQINTYDDQLLQLLGSRMQISSEIGRLKSTNNVTVLQSNRWNDILNRLLTKGESYQLSQDFIHSLLDVIHVESIRIQNTIQDGKTVAQN
jgi:chorismate mutase